MWVLRGPRKQATQARTRSKQSNGQCERGLSAVSECGHLCGSKDLGSRSGARRRCPNFGMPRASLGFGTPNEWRGCINRSALEARATQKLPKSGRVRLTRPSGAPFRLAATPVQAGLQPACAVPGGGRVLAVRSSSGSGAARATGEAGNWNVASGGCADASTARICQRGQRRCSARALARARSGDSRRRACPCDTWCRWRGSRTAAD
jgi:hypothetical protein